MKMGVVTQRPLMLASRLDLKKKGLTMRTSKCQEYKKVEKLQELFLTWIGVVIEEEEKDGERDRAGKDASEALNIPESRVTKWQWNRTT